MKIVFAPMGCAPFHGNTLDQRPLGGISTSVICLADALHQLGHEVTVLSELDELPDTTPRYLPQSACSQLGEVDVLVGVRDWKSILLPIKAKQRLFWTGDAHDHAASVGIGDQRLVKRIEKLLCVSDWHARMMSESSGFPANKTRVLRNGINPLLFGGTETRINKRLIYSSTPFRGLALLPALFRALKARHPELQLHIFSGYDVYAGASSDSTGHHPDFPELPSALNALPDCTVHGNVKQAQLAREYLKSSILVYPNTYAETSCITAMEAQAAGCPIVTSRLGALPETVGDAGILIDGTPGSNDYLQAFFEAAHGLLLDQDRWQTYSNAGLAQAQHCHWRQRAEEFVAIVEGD